MPEPREYLSAPQKNGKQLMAVDIFKKTWTWLNERGCAGYIPTQLLSSMP
jgi:hypothetical protein